MKRLTGIGIIAIMLTQMAIADDKSRSYNEPIGKTWTACVKAAGEAFTITHTEKEAWILTFTTGISITSNGMTCSVTLKQLDEKNTLVKLNTQKNRQLFAWGAGGRISDKYFKAVEGNLKDEPTK